MTSLPNEHPPGWTNPQPTGPYDLIVIGAGPAGLTAAITAAEKSAKVALIEKDLLGGECFNYGCISSKSIIRTSRLYADMRNARNFGGQVPPQIPIDFAYTMARMRRIKTQISGHIAVDQIRKHGIDIYFGKACFEDEAHLSVGDQLLSFDKAIIATGSRPYIPDIPGLAQARYFTNETIFDLDVCPESLLVIGGGALGCELAQAFARLGTKVTIVQSDPMFLDNVERDGAQMLSDALAHDGVAIHLNTDILSVALKGDDKIVDIVSAGYKSTIAIKHILVGTGQVPNTRALNPAIAKINVDQEGGIQVDDLLCTSNPKVYAVGNVCADKKTIHIPDAAARIAVDNALFGKRRKVQTLSIPWCIYTDPEIAHVGIQVKEARIRNIAVKTFTVLMHQVDRAIADSEDVGFVKIHVREGSDRILGATVVARHAGDIVNSITLAMSAGIGLEKLATVDYPYPTQGDAIKMAAAAYLRTARPPRARSSGGKRKTGKNSNGGK